MRNTGNSLFSAHDSEGIKLFPCLRLPLSQLNEHNLRYNFCDTANSMCACGIETTEHFLLYCHCFSSQRLELFDSLQNIHSSFLHLMINEKVTFLLYDSPNNLNKDIISDVIKFNKKTDRLIRPFIL